MKAIALALLMLAAIALLCGLGVVGVLSPAFGEDRPGPATNPAAKAVAAGVNSPTSAPAKADPKQAPPATQPAPTTKPSKAAASRSKGMDFNETALSTILDFLRDASDTNMAVNWRSLEAVGITKDTPVTVKASNISVKHALDLVFEHVNSGKSKLDSVYWVVDDGVVKVATGTALNTNLTTKVIEVGDLLITVPDFPGPRIDMSAAQTGGGTGGAGQSGKSVFTDTTNQQQPETREEAKKRMQDSLITVMKSSIGADMWAPDGKGSVSFLGTKLIISQTQLGFKLLEMNGVSK